MHSPPRRARRRDDTVRPSVLAPHLDQEVQRIGQAQRLHLQQGPAALRHARARPLDLLLPPRDHVLLQDHAQPRAVEALAQARDVALCRVDVILGVAAEGQNLPGQPPALLPQSSS